MRGLRGFLLAAAGISILGFVLALINAGPAGAAGPAIPPNPVVLPSHLGVPVQDFVLLQKRGDFPPYTFTRYYPDGTHDADEFVVPEGRFFVATDFEFHFIAESPGATELFQVGYRRTIPPLIYTKGHESGATADKSSLGVSSVSGTAGFVAGPLTKLVGDIGFGNGETATWIVRGYLVDAPTGTTGRTPTKRGS